MTYTLPEGVTTGTFTADTLPSSFNAPAGAEISYKIYGTAAGVGTATAEGEPLGYKITLTVNDTPTPIYIGGTQLGAEEYVDFSEQKVYKRTAQLFNKNAKDTNNGFVQNHYLNSSGDLTGNNALNVSEYIPIQGNTTYTFSCGSNAFVNVCACEYDSAYNLLNTIRYGGQEVITFTSDSNSAYLRISYRNNNDDNVYVIASNTAPDTIPPYLAPQDPPEPLPAITASRENTISSTETLGDVEFTGDWLAIMGSTQAESIDIGFTVDAEEYIAFATVDDGPLTQVSDTITMPSSADSFSLEVVAWGRERYTDTVYNALS